ncbi:MAG: folate family ECF transporter S component [Oscillospiraceae bacterium]|nr:folate family ECF transporter S component [Oscillospiraceae bacterium]
MGGKTKKLALSALLITADVILTRLLAINTNVMKIGLGFAAVALCALLYGPGWAALTAALGDLLGSLLFPTGAYFPGFTLTAACTGLIFGLLLKRGDRSLRPVLAAALNTLLVSYLANTWMICLITGNSMKVMLAARAVQLAVMLPLQSLVLLWLSRSGFIQGILEDAKRS